MKKKRKNKTTAKPPVDPLIQTIDYGELYPDQFETLIQTIIESDPEIEECRRYASKRGYRQHGIDIYARRKHTGEIITYQCKNTEKLDPGEIDEALEEFVTGIWAGKAKVFVLCTPCKLISPKHEQKREVWEKRLKEKENIEFRIWDGEWLNRKLKNRPDIVREFFHPDYVERFCRSEIFIGDVRRINLKRLERLPNGNLFFSPYDLGGAIDELNSELVSTSELADNIKESANEALANAKEYVDLGEYDGAEKALLPVRYLVENLEPAQKAKYYNILCGVKIGQERPEEALEFINRALANEDRTKYKLNQILCLAVTRDEENLKAAGQLLRQIPESETASPEYHYVSGIVYFETGDFERAVKANERALELDSTYYKSRINITAGLLKLEDFDRCDEEFKILKEQIKEDDVPTDLLFYTYYGNGFRYLIEATSDRKLFLREPDKEIPNLDELTFETLDFPPAITELADKARKEFLEAYKYARGSKRQQTALNEQFCHILKGEYTEAKSILQNLISEDLPKPLERTVRTRLANVHLILGDFEAAKKVCEQFVSKYERESPLFPGDISTVCSDVPEDILFPWANALAGFGYKGYQITSRRQDEIEIAVSILNELIRRNPGELSYKNRLAVIHSYTGQRAKAERLFLEIAGIDSADKRGLFNLGNHFGRYGEYNKAFLNYRKLQRRIGPDHELERAIPLAFGYHAVTSNPERKNRKYLAASLIEHYDRDEPDLNEKFPHLRILKDLYIQIAGTEDNSRRRNNYYDRALATIHKLSTSEKLLGPELKLLEKQRRYITQRKYAA